MSESSLRAAHLRVEGLSKSFADRRVLTNISFSVPHRDRIGIIGENGTGKTTLLRVIAGELTPDAGTIEIFGRQYSQRIMGLLQQQPEFPSEWSLSAVLEASVQYFRHAEAAVHQTAESLAEAPHDPTVLERYTQAVERAEELGVWGTDARMASTLTGLGLDALGRDQPISQLSGGQRARLAMASLLLSAPEVLLLDEPTNHLDDTAVQYLQTVIAAWPGPVLIVSHDRAFLDETVVSILDLDPAPQPVACHATDDGASLGVTRYSGTYSEYLTAQRAARRRWQQQYDEEQAQLRRLRAAVDEHQVVGHRDWKPRTETRMAQKYYADRNAKVVARRVNDARRRLATLEQHQIMKPPAELTFHGLSAAAEERSADASEVPLLVATDVALERRLYPTNLALSATDRLLVTGANGAGKSTLLQLLAGQLTPSHGTLQRHPKTRIGLLTQESSFHDWAGHTAQAVYEHTVGIDLATRVPLATFGLLRPRDEQRNIETLSIGQQRRLALAVVLADPPDVLLLDEPTNHLSLVLATELEDSIAWYPGAVVVASHDRWLRHRWQGRHLGMNSAEQH